MDDMTKWCTTMPKVELHAHLNGSITDSTLLELGRDLGEKGIIDFTDVEECLLKSDRSLVEVFKLFDLIHILTTNHDTVTRITTQVVQDFAADNVVYLELRTTPKKNDSKGMTKRSYMEAVIEGLRKVDNVDIDFAPNDVVGSMVNSCQISNSYKGTSRKKIFVRLLLSIDRRETLEAAMETVNLALQLKGVGVVGIDLSGNPKVGEWETFLPALTFAREQGLCVSLHCGEVPNQKEIHAMLDFHPERIGHACCFEEDAWRKLNLTRIPVEICLTSNIRTNTISSIDVHHFADLYKAEHPLILCTDDAGVFSTSLSKEYAIAAATFGIGKKELFKLARGAVEFSFAEERVVKELRDFFSLSEEELSL